MNIYSRKLIWPSVLVVVFTCLLTSNAKSQLTITGEITPRFELRNGFKKLRPTQPDPAAFTEQRTRLYTNYKSEKYEFQLTLQDVRFWGANGQVHKTDNAMFGIAEGWGRFYFKPSFSMKFGRQIISYDNQRFFGGLEWAMQGRRHDALLLMLEKEGLKLHIGLAYNQSPLHGAEPVRISSISYPPGTKGAYHATANYRDMEYAYLNKKYDNASISAYLVNEGRQYGSTSDSISYRQTTGLMGTKSLANLSFNGEFFYQFGKIGLSDLSAYMFSLSAVYKTKLTPVTLGYDYLSGTDPNSEKIGAWAPAFGTNHAFYGFMDYFYVGNPHSSKGLQDFYLKTKFKVGKGSLVAHAHYFLAAADIIDPADNSTAPSGLGTEIDLVYVKKLSDGVTCKLGYSQMFASKSMELIKGGGDSKAINNWMWLMISFKPVLFKQD